MTIATREVKVQAKVTSVYGRLAEAIKPIVVCVGGSGSSKSHSMAQLVLWKLINERDKVFGIGRKTFPALRMTAYKLVVDLLQAYGIYSHCDHNKTEHTLKFGGNLIQFFSLDDPEKIKSFNTNYLWLEEANEFTWEDFVVLRLRLNRPSGHSANQIFLTLNPVDEFCWVNQRLIIGTDSQDVAIVGSTYRDNPFVDPAYAATLEGLKVQDENYYRIYALGQWGKLENVIYHIWDIVDEMPPEFHRERYGVDFGYENPSVVLHLGIIGDNLYIDELLYQTHLTNAELIDRLRGFKRLDIYADSAEPQRIEEMCRAELRCYPAQKDVQMGIDSVKRLKLHITKRSFNTIKEIRGYQRKKDKDGRVLEEPVKFNDHSMDALRYGVFSKLQGGGNVRFL